MKPINNRQKSISIVFPPKACQGRKKCGDWWGNLLKDDGNCLCTDDESRSSPIHMPGVTWIDEVFTFQVDKFFPWTSHTYY